MAGLTAAGVQSFHARGALLRETILGESLTYYAPGSASGTVFTGVLAPISAEQSLEVGGFGDVLDSTCRIVKASVAFTPAVGGKVTRAADSKELRIERVNSAPNSPEFVLEMRGLYDS